MMREMTYVPVLRWRQGEYKALKFLTDDIKAGIIPLIEIPPIAWDFVEEEPQKDIASHLDPIPKQIREHWASKYFVDFRLLFENDQATDTSLVEVGKESIRFFESLGASASNAIPVTSASRDAGFQEAVSGIAKKHGTGACVRLTLEDAFGQSALAAVVSVLGIAPEEIDVVIDLRSVDPGQLSLLRVVLKGLLASFANQPYRSVSLVGSSFPIDLSDVTPGIGSVARSEWSLWTQLKKEVDTTVWFGDYGISHVDVREIDPRLMVASASIRYTTDNEWLIFRGRSLRESRYGGYGQYRALSTQVVNHSAYSGPRFSWGDDYLFKCAHSLVGTGNLTTWRQVGTNHHISFVVHQLAKQLET